METKLKSNSVVTVQQLDETKLQFSVVGAGSIVFDTSTAHPRLAQRAALHGWKQRISDAAAIPRDTETGKSASPEEKFTAMQALVEHYMTGTDQWSRVRSSEGGGAKSLTIEAIAQVRDISYADAAASVELYAEEKFGGDTKKCLAFFRSAKAVKAAILEIQSKRLPAASVDADEALGELAAA